MTDHTPGPWSIWEDGCVSCGGEWGLNGPEQGAHAQFSNKADAQLCAAAPELAVALKSLVAIIDHEDPWSAKNVAWLKEAVSLARAALAKARGETS